MAELDEPRDPLAESAPRADGLTPLAPDVIEQDFPDEIDNIIPTRGYEMLPVVGLGGSAGGIPALKKFFGAMPADSGMAFVVVLHLSPEHESILDELLGRSTAMPVMQVTDGLKVEANTVYVIPPGKVLAAADGRLRLTELQPERGKRMAVDLFFRTLADTHGPHAAAIVLSGADGDGALGLKRVKERGGLTIAQDPDEADHPSMPRTAIDTGMVDWVLPVEEMPARLMEYRANEKRLQLPSEEGPAKAPPTSADVDENALREVLAHLRTRTGRDFSYYKRATVVRRISRRMQVNGTETLPEYLGFLRTHPGEAGALQQDMLISVTNFFRDRDSFEALESRIPELFAGKSTGDAVRVWVAACATGEEAYSIAMLLLEYADRIESPPMLQIFATDLDEEVIATARDALYPVTIAADVSEERLRRFFVKEHRGYRVRRELRECVLFAVHDLLKDAAFSRLDLVSCRNLLIYLNRDAQARALDIFHFALRPGGRVFLGSSEMVDEESPLFATLDKKHRIFMQRPVPRAGLPVPLGPATLTRAIAAQERAKGGAFLRGASFANGGDVAAQRAEAGLQDGARVSWEELHFKLIERFAPPSLIVTRDHDIVHVSENAGRLLHFSGGEPSVNLLRVVHPMLRVELRAALFRAAQTSAQVEVFRVPVELNGEKVAVDIRVTPAQEIAPDYLLVVFSLRESSEDAAVQTRLEAEPAVRHLEREIEQLKTRLRDTAEQYEASAEELKASNEELQAMNEELRSSGEELETSREELQSINEELTTVNQDLTGKVDELARANSDLANLMAATGVATIFLDRRLRITRYTPTAVALFQLIASDLGRPLTDLTHQLNYPELKQDAESVIATLAPVKREVSDGNERWFLAQLLPYRTSDDYIAGVVLSFLEITESRKALLALRESEELMRFATEAANIYGWERDIQTLATRYASNAEAVLGFTPPDDAEGMMALIHPDDRALVQARYDKAQAEQGPFDAEFRFVHPQTKEIIWQSSHGLFLDRPGGRRSFVGITQNITARKRVEEALRESQERLRLIVENARDYAIFSLDLDRCITSWNSGAEANLGYSHEEAIGQSADIIFTAEDRAAGAPTAEAQTALAEGRAADERWHARKDGTQFWGSGVMMAMRDESGEAIGLVKIFRDQTEALRASKALEAHREELWAALQETERARADAEAAGRAKDHFLAVLSHELRTPLTPVLMAVKSIARMKNLPEIVTEAMEMIRRNIEIEAHFIDDLLDVTRITRGKLEMVREPMDVHEAVRRAIEISRPDIEGKRQQLTVSLEAGESQLSGDFTRLQQVFWNLLKNASKFTPEGGAIRITSRNADDRVVVEVADTGIGIKEEVMEWIFDAFAQGGQEVTRQFGGLGLGLAISKATVDGHGGSIHATSEGQGRGATVTVELPLHAAEDDG